MARHAPTITTAISPLNRGFEHLYLMDFLTNFN